MERRPERKPDGRYVHVLPAFPSGDRAYTEPLPNHGLEYLERVERERQAKAG